MIQRLRQTVLVGMLIVLNALLSGPAMSQEPADAETAIRIGDRRELFLDRLLLKSLEDDVRLRLHHPQPSGISIRFDEPWEGAFAGYVTVVKDSDRFLMFYRGLPQAGQDGTDNEVTCVATSDDGINWIKPRVGLFQYEGSTDNNIILMGQSPCSHNFAPFIDANPDVNPAQKFKALAGTESSGLIAYVSADGLSWSRLQDEPVFTEGVFDSQNVSFWSEVEDKYVCYFRTWTGGGYSGFRTVSRTTSDDFITWSEPVQMTFDRLPVEHLYTNQTTPYFRAPHIYIGLAARFQPGRRVMTPGQAGEFGVAGNYAGDCSDTVFLSTRGGSVYNRTFMESFIRPGIGEENWSSRSNYAARGIVPTGEHEVSVYMSRNYGQPTSYVQRLVLRTDGFASLSSGFDGGEAVTRLLDFGLLDGRGDTDGERRLVINMSTSAAGSIRVELQDRDGTPVPGFSLEDCDEVIGDAVERVVSWRGHVDVSALAGRDIRVRFQLKDSDLFAFRFQ